MKGRSRQNYKRFCVKLTIKLLSSLTQKDFLFKFYFNYFAFQGISNTFWILILIVFSVWRMEWEKKEKVVFFGPTSGICEIFNFHQTREFREEYFKAFTV